MICCLCVDADWAHPDITAHTLGLIERSGIGFTFFATEDQIAPTSSNCEIAWHPNFVRATAREELGRLHERFQSACGMRPHRLDWGDCDSPTLKEFGVRWTSATYRPQGYLPLRDNCLVDVSISWGDNWWFLKRLAPDYNIMCSNKPGIYVLNMHPIHVFLNTTSLAQYELAKACYHDPEALKELRNPKAYGVARIFDQILEVADMYSEHFLTISNALERFSFHPATMEMP